MSTLDYKILKKYGVSDIQLHERMHPDLQGRIATDLVTRWGMVAAMPDGEDSAGRLKLRLMTPDELVARAMETADRLVKAMHEAGNLLMLPSLPDPDKDD